jgi:multiple sugar transport system ATP-binding protein
MGRITLEGVRKSFAAHLIIKGADLDIEDGSFVVFVGPSGCGKTTLLRLIAGLEDVSEGRILIDGANVVGVPPAKRGLSMVFQSYALYPHMSVRGNIAFGLKMAGLPKGEIDRKVEAAAATLNLTPYLDRKPRELSGGQRQRVAIARALAVQPRVLVLDEPTSALDVTVQARVLALIGRLRDEHSLAYLLISHNLAVVERLCEWTAVLYLGCVAEQGPTEVLLSRPAHPYTQALRAAVPDLDQQLPKPALRASEPAASAHRPSGCPFHPRCPLAVDRCRTERPALREVAGRSVACHRAEEALEQAGPAGKEAKPEPAARGQ